MKNRAVISLRTGFAVAVLSALALVPWVMGVPGVQNEHARGWNIGMYALCFYVLAWIVIWVCWTEGLKRLPAKRSAKLLPILATISNALLVMFTVVMIYAFVLMSRP